jgi:hypothetical protein
MLRMKSFKCGFRVGHVGETEYRLIFNSFRSLIILRDKRGCFRVGIWMNFTGCSVWVVLIGKMR